MRAFKKLGYVMYAVILVILAIVLVSVVKNNGIYPSGDDTFYHIYRGEYLYKAIKEGNFFPLFDPHWYNGVEIMRYWPPLCAYIMAIVDGICGGDIYRGYLLFVALTFVLGGLSWAYVGHRLSRPYLGCFMGIMWYFMPNNLFALFGEGNLPRVLSMVFLPLLIYHVYDYMKGEDYKHLIFISLDFVLVALCHVGYAGMVAIGILIFVLVYGLINKKCIVKIIKVAISIILGFMMVGLYLVPSLVGGMVSSNLGDKADGFFQSILISIDPLRRIFVGHGFYFGLAAVLIAVIGVIGSHKDSIPGFLTGLIICFLTTLSGREIVRILPGNSFLWMLRFISIALCFILMGLMYWKSLKRFILLFLLLLLVADGALSYKLFYGNGKYVKPQDRFEEISDATLIAKARDMTTQRLALMDLSTLAAEGTYLATAYKTDTLNVFGAGWEAAVTAQNIVQLNMSVEEGYFPYLFDRCLELGADTVLVQRSAIKLKKVKVSSITNSAINSGYTLVASNNRFLLYHRDIEYERFGTVTKYRGIGIGLDARTISLAYPNVEETSDPNINHYTLDELKKYEVVYLARFTYDDRKQAEDFVKELSENGVKVAILADRIPEDKKQRINTFLGVSCQRIEFENGYPILNVRKYGNLDLDLFPQGYAKWNTYYLNGLDEVYGYFVDNDLELNFYGTKYNDNIIFLALNLPFYYSLTRDKYAELIVGDFLQIPAEQLPIRQVVPIDVTFEKDEIIIKSDYEGVNTSVSYHDIFSGMGIYSKNNFLYVDKGEYRIKLSYPYFVRGLLLSLLGVGLFGLYIYFNYRLSREEVNADESNN